MDERNLLDKPRSVIVIPNLNGGAPKYIEANTNRYEEGNSQ